MADLIQFRGGTLAQWTTANPVLAEREFAVITDTSGFRVGDGVTAFLDLPTNALSLEGNAITLNSISDPAAPASDKLIMYTAKIAGRLLPKYIGPSGIDSAIQPFLARNKVGYWCPPGNATTLPGVFGYTAPTAVGTATVRTITTSSLFTRMRRLGYVSAAGAGSLTSIRVAAAQVSMGGVLGAGFFKVIRFGISDAAAVAGARMFVGVSSSTSAPTNVEPSTLTQCVGVGHRAADTTMHIFYGGSSAQTPIDLGANFPADTRNTDVYELALFSPPDGECYYQVTRLNTGHVATGMLTGTAGGIQLPATTTLLNYMMTWRSNNTTALAVGIDIMSDYIETDY